MQPELLYFRWSHYNEKARWALEYKGVPHTRRTLLIGKHRDEAQRLTGQTALPILILHGTAIKDSTRIIEALEHAYPNPPLYPRDPDLRRRALELEEFFDEELGPHVRRVVVQNALKASLGGNGEALLDAVIGIPFPIPKTGHEPVWNHKVRYRGASIQRWNNQFAVTTSGGYNQVKIREDVTFPYSEKGATPTGLNNVVIYFLQIVTAPARLAGTITLVHETMDQVKEPRRAWQYNPGQRRLRRAPNVGYDNPGTAADGLRTNDQTDTYNGAMDRYTRKIVGKKEMFIPYNSFKLHDNKHKYADIIKKSHINQDLPRYELHRVWMVDSTTKPGTTHIYKRRTFYIDEDSWQIALVDIYDRRDQLWRWQEAHTAMAYDKPFMAPIGETIYYLQSNRYLGQAFNNEDPENGEKAFSDEYFAPANVSKQVIK